MKLLYFCYTSESQHNPKYLELVYTESPESNTVKIWWEERDIVTS